MSKATSEVVNAKLSGDEIRLKYAEMRVKCFTDQLNDSNPILTEISDAMTEEGECRLEMEAAIRHGDDDKALMWEQRMAVARQKKEIGNRKLMDCSAKYSGLMKGIREATESSNILASSS